MTSERTHDFDGREWCRWCKGTDENAPCLPMPDVTPKTPLRVLVACEFSGIVRDAFIAAGHDAISCDLLPSERPGPHIIGDVIDVLGLRPPPITDDPEYYPDTSYQNAYDWDMVLAFPPCTYLTNAGARWLYGGKGTEPHPGRWADMYQAAFFFAQLLNAPVPRIAIENPVMHGHAQREIARLAWFMYDRQIIQPWQFGHPETKATQLWLRGLPPLVPTDIVDGRTPRVHHASPGPDRWKERSRTLPGIAAAMAAQWGGLT